VKVSKLKGGSDLHLTKEGRISGKAGYNCGGGEKDAEGGGKKDLKSEACIKRPMRGGGSMEGYVGRTELERATSGVG